MPGLIHFIMSQKQSLTEKEVTFCELYVNGIAPYAGNAQKCYTDVFKPVKSRSRTEAMGILADPRIQEYIEKLERINTFDAKRRKEYIARHLEQIIEETATAQYYDRNGIELSPAALRSVSVQAMKLYTELYPIKEAQVNKLAIEGGEGGVIFNVIVPQADTDHETK